MSKPSSGDHSHDHNHSKGHAHNDHARGASRRALRMSLVVLFALMVIELVTGIVTNSLALISDAGHLLTDVAAVALALLAQWVATRPPSARRSFGYRRFEILAALANGVTLWLVSAYILYEGYHRFLEPEPVQGGPMLVVALVGLVGQTAVTLILSRAKHESLNVKGAYLHAMTDAVQSVGVVIAGGIIVLTGATIVDPAISVVIALFIAYGGGRIVYDASHVLLEGAPEDVDVDALALAMRSHEGVEKVTDLHVWSLTTGYNALSAHVVARQGSTPSDRESLRRDLFELIVESFSVQHVTLQVEEDCDDCRACDCGAWTDEHD